MNKKKMSYGILAGTTIAICLAMTIFFVRLYKKSHPTPPTVRPGVTSFLERQSREKRNGSHGLGSMIPLIEASQKVKKLEHLYETNAIDKPQIETKVIADLVESLKTERTKFKRHIEHIRHQTEKSTAARKIRSLLYYLNVIEENIQDLEEIITNRENRSASEVSQAG